MSETAPGTGQRTRALVKMLNEIAANTPPRETPEATAESVAAHLRKFWARPMKTAIRAHLDAGGDGLSELAVAAVRRL